MKTSLKDNDPKNKGQVLRSIKKTCGSLNRAKIRGSLMLPTKQGGQLVHVIKDTQRACLEGSCGVSLSSVGQHMSACCHCRANANIAVLDDSALLGGDLLTQRGDGL